MDLVVTDLVCSSKPHFLKICLMISLLRDMRTDIVKMPNEQNKRWDWPRETWWRLLQVLCSGCSTAACVNIFSLQKWKQKELCPGVSKRLHTTVSILYCIYSVWTVTHLSACASAHSIWNEITDIRFKCHVLALMWACSINSERAVWGEQPL